MALHIEHMQRENEDIFKDIFEKNCLYAKTIFDSVWIKHSFSSRNEKTNTTVESVMNVKGKLPQ